MEAKDWVTLVFSIVNLLAIIIIPIIAVVIGQRLQTKAKKREDKLQIFKILMTPKGVLKFGIASLLLAAANSGCLFLPSISYYP